MSRFAGAVLWPFAALTVFAASGALPGVTRVDAAQKAPLQSDWVRANLMKAHYRAVLALQDSVIRGDLAEVGPAADALAAETAPPGLPSNSTPYVAAMREAARRTARATSIEQAANGTASLLATCGDCHLAMGTRPAVVAPSSSALGGVVGHMLGHQQAVELMVEGLVVPSATSWQDGARGLKVAPLRRRELPPDAKLTRQIAATEDLVHRLADDAVSANDRGARVTAYGQTLTTCATCHSLHRELWGPAPR
jgi:cytochrome c553